MALEPTKHVKGRMWPPRRLVQPERPTGWKPHGIFAWLPKRLGRGLAGAWPR